MLPNNNEQSNGNPEGIIFEKAQLTERGQKRLEKILEEPIYRSVLLPLMEHGNTGIIGSIAYEMTFLDVTDTSEFQPNAEHMADLDVVWDVSVNSESVSDVQRRILQLAEESGLDGLVIENYSDHFYPKFAVFWQGRKMVEVYFAPDCAENITNYRDSLGSQNDTNEFSSFDIYSSAQQSVQESAVVSLGMENNNVTGHLSQISRESPVEGVPGTISTYREPNPHRLYSSETATTMSENATTLSELEDSYMALLKLKLSNLRQVVKSAEQTIYNTSWEEIPDALDLKDTMFNKAQSLGLDVQDFSALLGSRLEWYKQQASAYVARSIQGNPLKTVSWFRSRNLFSECAPGLDTETETFFDFTSLRGRGSLCVSEIGAPALESSETLSLSEVMATFLISAGEFDLEKVYLHAKNLEEHWSHTSKKYYGIGIKDPLDTTINAASIISRINQFQNGAAYRKLVTELQKGERPEDISLEEIGVAFREKVLNDIAYKKEVIQDIASLFTPVDNK